MILQHPPSAALCISCVPKQSASSALPLSICACIVSQGAGEETETLPLDKYVTGHGRGYRDPLDTIGRT